MIIMMNPIIYYAEFRSTFLSSLLFFFFQYQELDITCIQTAMISLIKKKKDHHQFIIIALVEYSVISNNNIYDYQDQKGKKS